MQQSHNEDEFRSPQRRKRLIWIVIAHVLVVGAFFTATFIWGNFA